MKRYFFDVLFAFFILVAPQILLNLKDDKPLFGENPLTFFLFYTVAGFIGGYLFLLRDKWIVKKQKNKSRMEN